jgi:hypothetical protein
VLSPTQQPGGRRSSDVNANAECGPCRPRHRHPRAPALAPARGQRQQRTSAPAPARRCACRRVSWVRVRVCVCAVCGAVGVVDVDVDVDVAHVGAKNSLMKTRRRSPARAANCDNGPAGSQTPPCLSHARGRAGTHHSSIALLLHCYLLSIATSGCGCDDLKEKEPQDCCLCSQAVAYIYIRRGATPWPSCGTPRRVPGVLLGAVLPSGHMPGRPRFLNSRLKERNALARSQAPPPSILAKNGRAFHDALVGRASQEAHGK